MNAHHHTDGTEHPGIACGQCVGTQAPQPVRTPSASATTVRVPRTFYDDHVARDLPAGIVVRTTARHYWVALDGAEFAELLSDAEHYAWMGTAEFGMESAGLVSSARATAAALRKAAAATP